MKEENTFIEELVIPPNLLIILSYYEWEADIIVIPSNHKWYSLAQSLDSTILDVQSYDSNNVDNSDKTKLLSDLATLVCKDIEKTEYEILSQEDRDKLTLITKSGNLQQTSISGSYKIIMTFIDI